MRNATIISALIGLVLLHGCAFTTVETARQLEPQEAVVSGSADFPGFLFILPRVNANAMYGVGGVGDLSAHAGTSGFSANAGLGARLYPNDRFTFSLQADASYYWMTFHITSGPDSSLATMHPDVVTALTPRVTTAVKDGEWFYGGLQSQIYHVYERNEQPHEGSPEFRFFAVSPSAVVGVDLLSSSGHRPAGLQVELSVSPVFFDQELRAHRSSAEHVGTGQYFSARARGPMSFQFSVGGYFRFP